MVGNWYHEVSLANSVSKDIRNVTTRATLGIHTFLKGLGRTFTGRNGLFKRDHRPSLWGVDIDLHYNNLLIGRVGAIFRCFFRPKHVPREFHYKIEGFAPTEQWDSTLTHQWSLSDPNDVAFGREASLVVERIVRQVDGPRTDVRDLRRQHF